MNFDRFPYAGLVFGALLFLGSLSGASQEDRATARLDTATIRLGEQTKLTLSLDYRVDQGERIVEWPRIGDTLTEHVEVVSLSPIDTVLPDKENDPYHFRQVREITITSFDSGRHRIPSFSFVLGEEDTLVTQSQTLFTRSVEVNPSEESVRDIKGIYSFSYSVWQWLKEHWGWVVAGLLLIGAIIAGILYWRKRKKASLPQHPPPAPAEPPHAVAIRKLEALEEEKLWQKGEVKPYYVALSQIVREYLEQRFAIHALEYPTEEILTVLETLPLQEDAKMKLIRVLKLADMVKFARQNPGASENEEVMEKAKDFVRSTRPPEPGEEGGPEARETMSYHERS